MVRDKCCACELGGGSRMAKIIIEIIIKIIIEYAYIVIGGM